MGRFVRMDEPVRPSSMPEQGFTLQARSGLVFGFGLSLALACQATPLSVSLQPTDAASSNDGGSAAMGPEGAAGASPCAAEGLARADGGAGGAGAASAQGSGDAEGAGTPCPASLTRCGAVCVDEATDSQNCGGCGLACDQCTNGRCIRVLASGQSVPGPLAVTSSEVIWANQARYQGAAILEVPIGGGAPQTLALAPSETTVNALAIDSGYVYWAKSSSYSLSPTAPSDGAVMKTPVTGGATTILASGQIEPYSVAVSGGVVYWSAQDGIMSVPTGGGSPVVFAPADDDVFRLKLAGGKAFWAVQEANDTTSIRTRELAPGAAEVTLVPADVNLISAVLGMAASSTDLYWAGYADNVLSTGCAVVKISLCGGPPSTFYTGVEDGADIAVAVDADSVYWMDEYWDEAAGMESRRILKAPVRGGTPITLVETAGEVWDLVVDDTSVYYTDGFSGTVVKVTPK
jgi:hypothetical protein